MNIKKFLRRYKVYHRLADYGILTHELVKEKLDPLVLKRTFPELRKFDALALETRQRLLPSYEQYISDVSNDGMAASLELSVFLMILCNIVKPKRILDLGSGYSSLVFRLYASDVNQEVEIWSIDDSFEWLEQTRCFLNTHHLDTGHLHTWDAFIKQIRQDGRATFDLVLHDLGNIETRKGTLKDVVTLANSNGVIILDDVHFKAYRGHIRWLLKESKISYRTLKDFTIDEFGRYSMLLTP